MTEYRAYRKTAMGQVGRNEEVVLERHGEQDHKTGNRREKMKQIKENELRKIGNQKEIKDAEKETEQGKQRKEQGKVGIHFPS